MTGTRDNVIFCDFGGEGAEPRATALDEALTCIRTAIAELNDVVNETLAVHSEASALEKEVGELLLKALDSMDIVAFQSRILLAGAGDSHADDAELVAMTLRRFVSAGVAVSQRLHALAGEHKSWIGAEARVLREIVSQAVRLETTAGDCIRAMRAEASDPDASG